MRKDRQTCLDCFHLVCKPFDNNGNLRLTVFKSRARCSRNQWPYLCDILGLYQPKKDHTVTIHMIKQSSKRFELLSGKCEYFEGET